MKVKDVLLMKPIEDIFSSNLIKIHLDTDRNLNGDTVLTGFKIYGDMARRGNIEPLVVPVKDSGKMSYSLYMRLTGREPMSKKLAPSQILKLKPGGDLFVNLYGHNDRAILKTVLNSDQSMKEYVKNYF